MRIRHQPKVINKGIRVYKQSLRKNELDENRLCATPSSSWFLAGRSLVREFHPWQLTVPRVLRMHGQLLPSLHLLDLHPLSQLQHLQIPQMLHPQLTPGRHSLILTILPTALPSMALPHTRIHPQLTAQRHKRGKRKLNL